MRARTLVLVVLTTVAVCVSQEVTAQSVEPKPHFSVEIRALPRVRSSEPPLAALVERAAAASPTFEGLLHAIDVTDGLVYIQSGRCTRGVRACMPLAVTIAGPHRLLRVQVEPETAACPLMASIAHELRHAIEVLQEPSLTSSAALFFFFAREGRHRGGDGDPLGAWETRAAFEVGARVLGELRESAKSARGLCRADTD